MYPLGLAGEKYFYEIFFFKWVTYEKILDGNCPTLSMCGVLGLCKMKGSCTAYISATMGLASAAVKVDFCSQHTGHTMDIAHLRLSTETRAEIAALLHEGVSVSKVMDTMRNSVGQSQQRDGLLNR